MHFVSVSTQGVGCYLCSKDATHKVGEEIPFDDVHNRHNFTAYVCCECFENIFGSAVFCTEKDKE